MAKYEKILNGNFEEILKVCNSTILDKSMSANLEDESYFENDGVKVYIKVYERYSFLGKNRVSLNLTLIGTKDKIFISAITSGGSKAMFLKINTFGEKSFLKTLRTQLKQYE